MIRRYPLLMFCLAMSCLSAQRALADDSTSSGDRRAAVHTQLAGEYLKRGQYNVAVQEVREALTTSPRYPAAFGMLGLIYAELRDDAQATANFKQALEYAPNDPDLNNNYGWYLCGHGKPKEGVQYYLNALKNPLYPTPDKTLLSAGQCAATAGDYDNAKDYFTRVMRYRPDSVDARFQLAELGLKTKDYVLTRQNYNEVQRMAQPSAQVTFLGLRLEHALGNKEAEARLSEILKRQYPDSIETTRLLSGQLD
ncbi:cellulose synthase subunit BcsC [Amantichitinum ursilacus]|uniref:Cellulose synthase subunit BcsC n=2 Tax=Amantichitinum ursilacus TaxID=857265 RepID=A0A0N0GNM0_9NEIS|nr:cellulose synthase subunit BcsC [Amantichitinum ursilacus]